jgi:CheY-like chemotaxis protein
MKTILLIEDDKSIRNALTIVLENANYRVVLARNGSDALEKLRSSNQLPQLIILDLLMPVMNGIEFRQAQLADQRLSSIPVILLTANNNLKNFKESLQAYEFLNKPVEAKDLLYIVDNFFYLSGRTTSA